MKKLDRLVSEILIQRLIDCALVKSITAKSLGISGRGYQIKFLIIKKRYPDLYQKIAHLMPAHENDDFYCHCFPTNKERLYYADTKRFRY